MTLLERGDDLRATGADQDPAGRSDEVAAAIDFLAWACEVNGQIPAWDDGVYAWVESHPDPDQALGELTMHAAAMLDLWSGPAGATAMEGARAEVAFTAARDEAEHLVVEPVALAPGGLVRVGPPNPVRPVTDPPGLDDARRRKAIWWGWVRNAGVIVLVFLMYWWWGTGFEQRRAQAHLRATWVSAPSALASASGAPPAAAGPSPGHGPVGRGLGPARVLPGGVVSRLEIPAIHVDQFVVEGTSEGDLKKGPGHYLNSSIPGQPGNAAIAGHRTTYGAPFNRIGDLRPGDTIITTTAAGRFLYSVSGGSTVPPSQTSVLEDYGDNRLTLTTCTPEFSATQRLIVVAALEGTAPVAAPARVAPPPRLATTPVSTGGLAAKALRASAQGFEFGALLLALVVAVGLVGLGFAYRPVRRRLPPVAAVVVLVPFWLCGLLLMFEQVVRFMPPNV